MRSYSHPIGRFVALSVLVVVAGPGCGLFGPTVPSVITIELPDGTSVEATLGSGVISLADSEWDFFRGTASAQGLAFVRVQFGPNGNLAGFVNNTIASDIFGPTLIFDGARHDTLQAGLQYSAATFGAETSDSTGFTFEVLINAFAAGIPAATANATATAQFDPEDPNVVTGTFAFKSEVTLLSIPEGNIDDTFSFVGRKVTGQ